MSPVGPQENISIDIEGSILRDYKPHNTKVHLMLLLKGNSPVTNDRVLVLPMFHHQQNNLEKNKLMRKKDSQRADNITFPHCTSHYCFEFKQNILGILVLNIHTLSSLHTLSNVRKTRNLHKQYQSSFWLIYCIRRNDLDS